MLREKMGLHERNIDKAINEKILSIENVTKSYGVVQALRGVTVEIGKVGS